MVWIYSFILSVDLFWWFFHGVEICLNSLVDLCLLFFHGMPIFHTLFVYLCLWFVHVVSKILLYLQLFNWFFAGVDISLYRYFICRSIFVIFSWCERFLHSPCKSAFMTLSWNKFIPIPYLYICVCYSFIVWIYS